MKTLVLGMGNTLIGDDGVGIRVVQELENETCWENVCFEATSVSGIALLETISGFDRLIVIDTIRKENPNPGAVHVLGLDQLRAVPGPSPHYVSFPQMIEIGRRSGIHMPTDVVIVGIEARDMWVLREGLSEELERKVPSIVSSVKDVINGETSRCLSGCRADLHARTYDN